MDLVLKLPKSNNFKNYFSAVEKGLMEIITDFSEKSESFDEDTFIHFKFISQFVRLVVHRYTLLESLQNSYWRQAGKQRQLGTPLGIALTPSDVDTLLNIASPAPSVVRKNDWCFNFSLLDQKSFNVLQEFAV